MKNQQLYSRLAPEAVERVIRRFNDRELTMQEAMSALSISRAQVYNLRTQWLAAGKNASFLGASGGDRKSAWPTACVEELKTLIEASKDDGPNFELYADELVRKHDFVRDRSSVRKFCEKNLMPLMRSTFPVERKKPDDHYRRWEAESYGEIYQHDSTPRHIWGADGVNQSIILSLDDATRQVTAPRVCERENLLEHYAMLEPSFLRYGMPEAFCTDGFTLFGHEGEDLCSQFGRMCRAFGINHMIAPTPQAKGEIERAMRTSRASISRSGTGRTRTRRPARSPTCGRSGSSQRGATASVPFRTRRPCACSCRDTCPGRLNSAAGSTSFRPENRGFYVLEERPDPTNPVVPRILLAHRF